MFECVFLLESTDVWAGFYNIKETKMFCFVLFFLILYMLEGKKIVSSLRKKNLIAIHF